MRKTILLKPHEAAALASGETITIWRLLREQPIPGGENERICREAQAWNVYEGVTQGLTGGDQHWELLHGVASPFPLNVPLLGKETWTQEVDPDTSRPIWSADGNTYKVLYAADGEEVFCDDGDGFTEYNKDGTPRSPWRHPSHLPDWAVRTIVTLSDVRVRRPCDVTEEEAKAMGFKESFRFENGIEARVLPDDWFQAHFRINYGRESESLYHWSYTATPTKKAP